MVDEPAADQWGDGRGDRPRRGPDADRLPAPLAGLAWQRIAAAMLVAAMLGGMLDLVLAAAPGEAPDVVMLDPLEGLTEAELQ